jgi:arylsulfatase A-like enzyme/peroxiredoxin
MKSFCISKQIAFLAAIAWLTPCFASEREVDRESKGPNIVYFLADDLGWGDVGWHGSDIPTPNLDKLAKSGAELDFFYVQSVCTPTRAALLTGRYPIRHGLQVGVVRPWAQYGLPLEEQTLAQGLRTAGYATAIVGKWHLGHFRPEYLPRQRGFDHQYGHYNGALDYFEHMRDGGLDWHRDDKGAREEGYTTHLIADEATRIVHEYAGKKPFFLYVPFNAVHAPHQVPDSYLEKFQHLTGERKLYAGMLTAMDEAIGKIVDAIDQSGQRANTLFLFSSDNGGPAPGKVTSNGPLRGQKGTAYEGGVRVPAFASWEGKIPAGSIVKEPLHIVDLYPTLLKLAGANIEQRLPLDGVDIWETIAEGKPSPHREILINAAPHWGALRAGEWKIVVNGGREFENFDGDSTASVGTGIPKNVELFNLQRDPNETTDLAASAPDKVKELLDRWLDYRQQALPTKTRPKPSDYQAPEVWGETSDAQTALESLGPAPHFDAIDQDGNAWRSADHFGKNHLVFYFYPADFTGGCTKQACAYRDSKDELEHLGAKAIGISGDSAENHRKFKQFHRLNFTLLADSDGKIAEAFGVPINRELKEVRVEIDGQSETLERQLTSKRWTFIVNRSGEIVYKNAQVTAADDAAQVVEFLKNLSKEKR